MGQAVCSSVCRRTYESYFRRPINRRKLSLFSSVSYRPTNIRHFFRRPQPGRRKYTFNGQLFSSASMRPTKIEAVIFHPGLLSLVSHAPSLSSLTHSPPPPQLQPRRATAAAPRARPQPRARPHPPAAVRPPAAARKRRRAAARPPRARHRAPARTRSQPRATAVAPRTSELCRCRLRRRSPRSHPQTISRYVQSLPPCCCYYCLVGCRGL
jgi:hypothetical protein